MKLDVSSLRDAVGQLERSLSYLRSPQAQEDAGLWEQFRAASIQGFECAYELATKMVRRQMEQQALNPAQVRALDFMALMRQAADAGLVASATPWHAYLDLRNRTSHTYDQAEAEAVVERLDGFLADAKAGAGGTGEAEPMRHAARRLDVSPQELAFIQQTLERIGPGRTVWAFGSRVTGRARPNSDLDLCILGAQRLPVETMARLREAFEESPLRFAVDVVEWAAISARFRKVVEESHADLAAPDAGAP